MLRGVLSAGYSQDAMNSLYAKGYDIASTCLAFAVML